MKIIAHTPIGEYHSIHEESDEPTREQIKEYLAQMCNNGTYFKFVSAEGVVFFPRELIQRSVFIVVE